MDCELKNTSDAFLWAGFYDHLKDSDIFLK